MKAVPRRERLLQVVPRHDDHDSRNPPGDRRTAPLRLGRPCGSVVDCIIPVYDPPHDQPVARVYRAAETTPTPPLYAAIMWGDVDLLVGCRRISRVEDPTAAYILADGTIWRSVGQCAPPTTVWGQVMRRRESSVTVAPDR